MTYDEKLAIIAGNLRDAAKLSDDSVAYVSGTLLELAEIAIESGTDDALSLARLVLSEDDREIVASFCKTYFKYKTELPVLFPQPETAELQNTVIIPEIGRLEEAVGFLNDNGFELDIAYGDSFSACAEDVLYGHSRYVLMPMSDPIEGRLYSFDRLREKYGFKIHAVVNITFDEGGVYAYKLCALGFPEMTDRVPEKLYFTADTTADTIEYLRGISVFGVRVLTLQTEGSRIKAALDCTGLGIRDFLGLMMYLSYGADLTVDGCYNEI